MVFSVSYCWLVPRCNRNRPPRCMSQLMQHAAHQMEQPAASCAQATFQLRSVLASCVHAAWHPCSPAHMPASALVIVSASCVQAAWQLGIHGCRHTCQAPASLLPCHAIPCTPPGMHMFVSSCTLDMPESSPDCSKSSAVHPSLHAQLSAQFANVCTPKSCI